MKLVLATRTQSLTISMFLTTFSELVFSFFPFLRPRLLLDYANKAACASLSACSSSARSSSDLSLARWMSKYGLSKPQQKYFLLSRFALKWIYIWSLLALTESLLIFRVPLSRFLWTRAQQNICFGDSMISDSITSALPINSYSFSSSSHTSNSKC